MLLRNSRSDDRKGGKLIKSSTGPYIVILFQAQITLKNLKGQILKTKLDKCLYNEKITNGEQEITFDEMKMQISIDKIGKYATIEMRILFLKNLELVLPKIYLLQILIYFHVQNNYTEP